MLNLARKGKELVLCHCEGKARSNLVGQTFLSGILTVVWQAGMPAPARIASLRSQ
jgi:hypothetical protein